MRGYFDHSATTPPYPEVVEAIGEVMLKHFGNPSSLHRLGMQAEQLVSRSREVIGQSLGVPAQTILFTSGGTESNNLAVKGTARTFQDRGRHLVTTAIEHASVHEAFRQLEREGFEVSYVPPGKDGIVHADEVMAAVREDTVLVSVMLVNNETGAIQPVEQIGSRLKARPKTAFHVDAVQGIGRVPFFRKSGGSIWQQYPPISCGGRKGLGCFMPGKVFFCSRS
ncbi:cysteine desulfurase [Xylanibacillus composti]|uniref:Cysteine desulfurase n=1 Tax=Xylanibacillus composti TaxID=1572762 RepID=A0A8J4M0N5_9BACL|nr:aminotransferase class V-fold PLP-dependent enzyme [Xylanibacillus composti]GIQ67995.1 cysteine desulfurase [Xylanibacillus composti]